MVFSVLVLWMIFYVIGLLLLSMLVDFYEGMVWWWLGVE